MGVAFQIQDDILDIILGGAKRKKFGKIFGNDIREGKRSLMVIYALNKSSPKDKKKLLWILDKPEKTQKDIKEAIGLIKNDGIIVNDVTFARLKAVELPFKLETRNIKAIKLSLSPNWEMVCPTQKKKKFLLFKTSLKLLINLYPFCLEPTIPSC